MSCTRKMNGKIYLALERNIVTDHKMDYLQLFALAKVWHFFHYRSLTHFCSGSLIWAEPFRLDYWLWAFSSRCMWRIITDDNKYFQSICTAEQMQNSSRFMIREQSMLQANYPIVRDACEWNNITRWPKTCAVYYMHNNIRFRQSVNTRETFFQDLSLSTALISGHWLPRYTVCIGLLSCPDTYLAADNWFSLNLNGSTHHGKFSFAV